MEKINIHDLAFWFCLFFILGVGLISLFPGDFYRISIVVLLLSLYSLLIKKYYWFGFAAVLLSGVIYYQIFSYVQLKSINIPFNQEGEYTGLVREARSGINQELKISLTGKYRGNISVKTNLYPEFRYGDLIKIIGKINQPKEEYKSYYLSRDIWGETNFPKIELLERDKGNFIKGKLVVFREQIKNIFKNNLSKEKAAFLAGITIGAREDFSKEFKEKMSLSGTTHLVALSGYNISIIILAVGLVLGSFFSSAVSFYLSVLTIVLFVLMAGAEASVVRAAIMGAIGLFAVQTERLFNPRNAIVVTAFVMALYNPRVLVFDIGFQLSFAALLGIVYLAPALKNLFKIKNKGFLSWKENALTTSAAQILALPILLSSFGIFSLTSLLANILILEFIPITMGLGFSMAFLGLFSGFLAKIMAVMINVFVSYEFFIINIFSRASILIQTENLGVYLWAFYYLLILLFVLIFYNKEDGKKFSFFVTICIFLIATNGIVWYLILFPNSITIPEIYFLNVGQGDGSLLLLPGFAGSFSKFLIDGGPITGNLDKNLEKIIGMDRYIDVVFVSHPQLDHYGGLIDLLKNYEVGVVIYNGEENKDSNWQEFSRIIEEKEINKIIVTRGDKIIFASSTINIMNPDNFSTGTNGSGLVMNLDSYGLRALFTADIDGATERIMAKLGNIKSDVLKVSHHGSKYSSDSVFLKEVEPKISVIEVGKNSYGHPAKEALQRLSLVGSKIFTTYDQGIIKVIKEANVLKVFNL